jgi:eukaryotic-like serine/threonine-protein kinase
MTAVAEPVRDSQLATSWELAEGDEIAPGRTALKRLGGGRRYDAYLAFDGHMHAVVVCKVVRPHLVDDERTLRGLREEWEMLNRLSHPVILRGFDAVLDGERPHLVLEHLEGPRLSTLIRRYGPLTAEQLVPLAVQLASAVHYLTNEGVVHLDIKPSNTIMGAPPRMIDLSVALTAADAAALRTQVGTDAYMAPEQCDPERLGPVGSPADVWGLGVTLYRAATGELPYDEPPDDDDHDAPLEQQYPQLAQRALPIEARIPPDVAEAIIDCLAFEPERRPSPAELADRLEPVLGAMPKPRLSKLKPRLR